MKAYMNPDTGAVFYRTQNGNKVVQGDDRKLLKILSFDNTESDPALQAKEELTDYVDRVYACTLNDAGQETKILATPSDPNVDSQFTDGSEGQAMVKFPRLWYKYDLDGDGNMQGFYLAGYAKAGYTLHPAFSWGDGRDAAYIGMYEASSSTTASVLQSISGITPRTSRTLAQFRSQAEARGSGWHQMSFWTQHLLDMLFYAVYETRDSQGALPGYTEESGWDTSKMRETGRSNVLTDMNGSVDADLGGVDSDLENLSEGEKIANRFLFVENIFGHIWKFNDGVTYVPEFDFDPVNEVLPGDGSYVEGWNADWGKDLQAVYHTPDITKFSSVATDIRDNYEKLSVTPVSITGDGEIQKAGRSFVPTAHGGTTGQNFCARFYGRLAATDRPYLRVVRAGGSLVSGALAGVACRSVFNGLSDSHSAFGARLCFSRI